MAKLEALLSPGTRLQTIYSKKSVIVGDLLGGGGQGQVFKVQLDSSFYALKWYNPHYVRLDSTLRERLEKSIELGPPNEHFWWPFELVGATHSNSFGYIMPLREPGYEGLIDLMRGEIATAFPTLILMCFYLADSFLRLHGKGLCYKDISFGNVFFHPQTGNIRICDIDNVDVNGRPGAILGTAGFMAPEVIRGEKGPSTQTDLHSLAVMIFNVLLMGDPLDGARASGPFDERKRQVLYGTDPLFIFDPDNTSNRPVPGEQDAVIARWAIYPIFLREMFTRAFTKGLKDPMNGRVREGEWREAMSRLYDSLFPCNHCGGANFYDRDQLRASGGKLAECWSCGQCPSVPPRLRIGTEVVMLANHSRLFGHHLNLQHTYDLSKPLAEVEPSPLALRNLSTQKWVLKDPDGSFADVSPGACAPLTNGTKLFFGSAEGEVRL